MTKPLAVFIYRNKRTGDNPLVLWGVDKHNTPSAFSEFAIVLTFDEGQNIVIPVNNDHLDVQSATLPQGLALEPVAASR